MNLETLGRSPLRFFCLPYWREFFRGYRDVHMQWDVTASHGDEWTARVHAEMVGRFVLDIQCDGCMAEDHRLKRVGEIVAVKNQREIFGPASEAQMVAVCRTIQSREDAPEELFYVPIRDGSFQLTPSGNGYFRRH